MAGAALVEGTTALTAALREVRDAHVEAVKEAAKKMILQELPDMHCPSDRADHLIKNKLASDQASAMAMLSADSPPLFTSRTTSFALRKAKASPMSPCGRPAKAEGSAQETP
jgi:hypothetical protein